MFKGASFTLTGSAVSFLFRSLSFWSLRGSSACCFLSSLRWLSEIFEYVALHIPTIPDTSTPFHTWVKSCTLIGSWPRVSIFPFFRSLSFFTSLRHLLDRKFKKSRATGTSWQIPIISFEFLFFKFGLKARKVLCTNFEARFGISRCLFVVKKLAWPNEDNCSMYTFSPKQHVFPKFRSSTREQFVDTKSNGINIFSPFRNRPRKWRIKFKQFGESRLKKII